MKAEADAITEDEWLLRLVFEDRFTGRIPPISPNAFEPRAGRHPDSDGLSLFRHSCLADPEATLAVVAPEKRQYYGIVRIPVKLLASLEMTVRPAPIELVKGHVVIPELNIVTYKANKASFTIPKLRLAEAASANIVRLPPNLSSS